MNSKKAKKIRQLARHLVSKSGAEVETTYEENVVKKFVSAASSEGEGFREEVRVTRTLNPNCARSLYRQMKKNV